MEYICIYDNNYSSSKFRLTSRGIDLQLLSQRDSAKKIFQKAQVSKCVCNHLCPETEDTPKSQHSLNEPHQKPVIASGPLGFSGSQALILHAVLPGSTQTSLSCGFRPGHLATSVCTASLVFAHLPFESKPLNGF